MGRGQASSFGGRHEKCIRNMLGTPIKSRAGMQVGEAVQGRDRDRRGNCGEKPPNYAEESVGAEQSMQMMVFLQ